MAIVINGSGTVTGLAVGGLPDGTVDEGTLATDSVTAAKIPASLENTFVSGRKNLIINGAMNVAQRGTSQTAGGYGSLDRWRLALSGATATLSQETFTVGQTDVPNEPENYMKLNVTTGDNNCGFEHRVENVRSVVGVHTLSFWAKGVNPAGGEVTVKGEQRFDNATDEVQITGDEITLTTSWQKFTISMTPTSLTGTGTPGASSYVRLQFLQPTGDTGTAAWNINIAQVQLERGSVATDFEHRSYGEELALCQRYYYLLGQGTNTNTGDIGIGSYYNSSSLDVAVQFPSTMRATPTLDATSGTNYYVSFRNNGADYFNSFSIAKGSSTVVQIGNNSEASGTGGQATVIRYNSASASIGFDAEL